MRAFAASLRTCAVAAICASGLVSDLAQAEVQHRFAILVGNDSGGADTRPLRYAAADAGRLHEILTRLGDVRSDDAELLLGGTADGLRKAFARTEDRIAEATRRGEKSLLVLYFSGHAKDGALRLGESAIALDEVRTLLSGSRADARVGVVDACRSGELTRTKGARKAPAFKVDGDVLRAARGLVLLTASAADEDAQESDALGGSYFSHHLASGLLGTADLSGDGRVTLGEAYAYAYERTVADTADTSAGAQHPTFSYDLAGNGEVVLTRVDGSGAQLVVPAEAPEGSYFVVDSKGAVAAEVAKSGSHDRRVALVPGSYRVKRRLPDRLRVGSVELVAGRTARLDEATLRDVPFSDDPVKGASREAPTHWDFSLAATRLGFFTASVFPGTGLAGLDAQLHDYLRRDFVVGFDLALGGSEARLGLGSESLPYSYGLVTGGASIVREWPGSSWIPFAGVRLGAVLMTRRFADVTLPSQSYFATTPGLVGGVRWRVAGSLSLGLRLRAHYLYFNVDRAASLGYVEGALSIGYDPGGVP